MAEEIFEIVVVETQIKKKVITLKKEDDIVTLEKAEEYVAEALQNISFSDLDNYPTIEQEYELTYNGKQDYEVLGND